jgi:opacity protein-like surface antigen
MSNRRSLAWAACALLTLVGTAHAQSSPPSSTASRPIEISPFVSTGSGEASGAGATIRWPVLGKLGLEVDTEYRSGASRGLAGSVNFVYDLPMFKRITPYAVGGIGMERYDVSEYHPTFGFLARRSTTPFYNFGGGIRVPINDRWGFRADLRYSAPLADRAPERVRVFWGATVGLGKR